MPQQLQGEFRKLVFVGASPTRGSSFKSGSWCNSSISPCEGGGPGANPGFLTISKNENARRAPNGDWPIRKRILLREQSQPRHDDLNAGIWMRAVRRAPAFSRPPTKIASRSYSPARPLGSFSISHFEPVRSESGRSRESPCITLVQSRFESARWLKTNSIGWRREQSHHGSGQLDPRASAA